LRQAYDYWQDQPGNYFPKGWPPYGSHGPEVGTHCFSQPKEFIDQFKVNSGLANPPEAFNQGITPSLLGEPTTDIALFLELTSFKLILPSSSQMRAHGLV